MRKSNEFKARELAAQRGITITTDHNDRGAIIRINLDGPYRPAAKERRSRYE